MKKFPYTFRINDKFSLVKLGSEDNSFYVLVGEDEFVRIECPKINSIFSEIIKSQSASISVSLSDGPSLHLMHQLKARDILTDQSRQFSKELSSFWATVGIDTREAFHTLKKNAIKVFEIGCDDSRRFRDLASSSGLRFSPNPEFAVVFVDDYLNPSLRRFANSIQIPWLIVKTSGTKPRIGPIFDDSAGANCFSCFQQRLLLNDHETQLFHNLNDTKVAIPRPLISHPATKEIAFATTVLELSKYFVDGKHHKLKSNILEINCFEGIQSFHHIFGNHLCPICNPKGRISEPIPIEIKPQVRDYGVEGGYRCKDPEITFHEFKKFISPICGIVPYIREYGMQVPGLIYNYSSGPNVGIRSKSSFWMNMHLRSINGGKGKSEIQAKVGALCEGIERFCMLYPGNTFTVTGSQATLSDALHPNSFMLFSESQYARREEMNKGAIKFHALTPVPFEINKMIEWTPVYSLTEKKFKYLPTGYCYSQYPSNDEKAQYSYPDSNGIAAGNTLEEAILQGFLELVERDAAAIWWYNRLSRPGVDLNSINNNYINAVRNYYVEKLGRSIHVLDITTDLGIPVFVSISFRPNHPESNEILFAFGAHFDPNIAIERSIIELNQLLPATTKTFGKYNIEDPAFLHWMQSVKIEEQPWLLPKSPLLNSMEKIFSETFPSSIQDAISDCIRITKEKNLELLVLDLTNPDIGLPVARVFVPGLRHFWRRTAPGRLFDVPVQMGWKPKACRENELNPISIFI